MGNVVSIKDKLRRKIENNAFKRFSNIYDSNGNMRTERVDENHIRQLLALVKKGAEINEKEKYNENPKNNSSKI